MRSVPWRVSRWEQWMTGTTHLNVEHMHIKESFCPNVSKHVFCEAIEEPLSYIKPLQDSFWEPFWEPSRLTPKKPLPPQNAYRKTQINRITSVHFVDSLPDKICLLILCGNSTGIALKFRPLVALKRCDLQNARVCDLVALASWRCRDLKRCDLGALKERGQCDLGTCVPRRSVSSCDLRFKTAV